MDRVRFYSEHDLAVGFEISKIIKIIQNYEADSIWTICDLLEFHNILKYFEIEHFADYIGIQTGINTRSLDKEIREKMGRFINKSVDSYIDLFVDDYFLETQDFLEIIENYKLFWKISNQSFRRFLGHQNVHLFQVLKFKEITKHYDLVIKEVLTGDCYNAEILVSKYLGESKLYLPKSLKESEVLELIEKYIDSTSVNINVLRKIITFPTNRGINIPDKIKLRAIRKEKVEIEKLFERNSGMESSIHVSYQPDQIKEVIVNFEGIKIEIKVSQKWIEDHKDYPTLWNNFIYIFGIADNQLRSLLVSKKNDMSALEAAIGPSGDHIYKISRAFTIRELIATVSVNSYIHILNSLGIKIENMIEWFFTTYILDEFSVEGFYVKMPSELSPYFEKCRSVLPELDRIIKQYNLFVEDGFIDQDLLQLSSNSFKLNEIKSLNQKKYVYPLGDWYNTVTHLIFSNQSHIFYLPKKEEYENFFELIINDSVKISDFQDYQLANIQWLLDNSLISLDENSFIRIVDMKTVSILKELYSEDVLSYWHYSVEYRDLIDKLESSNIVSFDDSLLSRNEQDYFDYILNKSKYTNGLNIRNKYLHGTNTNDEDQYKKDYYSIIKLLIVLIIKINDDLCLDDGLKNK